MSQVKDENTRSWYHSRNQWWKDKMYLPVEAVTKMLCAGVFYKSLHYFLSKQEKLKDLIIFQRYWSCRCEHNFYLCVYVFNKSTISLFLKGNTLQSYHNSIFKSCAMSWNNEHVIIKVSKFVSLSYLGHFLLKGQMKKKNSSTLKLYQFSVLWKWKIMFQSFFFFLGEDHSVYVQY